MKVLVPVDGSGCSEGGLKVASHFAKAMTAGVYLITVVPLMSGMEVELSVSERELVQEGMRRRGEEVLEGARAALSSMGVNYIRTVLTSSTSAAHEIVGFAEMEKVDLIVIGSRGAGSSARFFLGSVATKVVRHSPCSVHVVREPRWA